MKLSLEIKTLPYDGTLCDKSIKYYCMHNFMIEF